VQHAALAAEVRFLFGSKMPSGAGAQIVFRTFAARLKPCPSFKVFFRTL
jgi:hypothetical protein